MFVGSTLGIVKISQVGNGSKGSSTDSRDTYFMEEGCLTLLTPDKNPGASTIPAARFNFVENRFDLDWYSTSNTLSDSDAKSQVGSLSPLGHCPWFRAHSCHQEGEAQ